MSEAQPIPQPPVPIGKVTLQQSVDFYREEWLRVVGENTTLQSLVNKLMYNINVLMGPERDLSQAHPSLYTYADVVLPNHESPNHDTPNRDVPNHGPPDSETPKPDTQSLTEEVVYEEEVRACKR